MATATSVDDTCRLCLDPSVESFNTIENPALKNVLEKVFCFPIEFKEGITSSVCQICSNTITEFYEYSEKVRHHQAILEAAASAIMTGDELFPAKIKIELDSDTGLPIVNQDQPPKMSEPLITMTESSDNIDFIDKMLRKKKEDATDQFIRQHLKLTCELCGIVAPTFRELRYHFLDEHQRQYAYTRCCGKKLTSRQLTVDHIHYHLDSNVFHCAECKDVFTTFATKKALELHKISKHSERRMFKCDRCPLAYANSDLLQKHSKRHEMNECIECRKCFLTKSALDEHMECHMPQECTQCKKLFTNQTTLRIHIANVHNKDTTYKFVCEQCGKHFARKIAFQRHMNEHAGIEAPKVQCTICGRWLKKMYYKNHMDTVHGNRERVHECDICHRMYPHAVALQNHKSKAHIEPRHKCEFCGKLFIQKNRWLDHLTSHTDAMLHSCEYCGAPYKTRSNVHKHIRTKHAVEWAEKKKRDQSMAPEETST